MRHLHNYSCAFNYASAQQVSLTNRVVYPAFSVADERITTGYNASTSGRAISASTPRQTHTTQRRLVARRTSQSGYQSWAERPLSRHAGERALSGGYQQPLTLEAAPPQRTRSPDLTIQGTHNHVDYLSASDVVATTVGLPPGIVHTQHSSNGGMKAIAHEEEDELLAQLAGRTVHNVSNLRKLLTSKRYSLRPRHYRHALGRLSALIVDEPPASAIERQHVQSILELISEGLSPWVDQLRPQEVTSIMCALAKMHYYDGPLLKNLIKVSMTNIVNFQPHQTSGLLWAFGRYHLSYQLPVEPQWTSCMLSHLHQDLGFAVCGPGALIQALYGCALLQQPPQRVWATDLLIQLDEVMEELSAGDLCRVLWALAKLHIEPERIWMEKALQRIEADIRNVHCGTLLSSMLWALATFQHAPSASWMEQILWRVQLLLRTRLNAQNISVIAWSLASLRYRPHRGWLEQFLKASILRIEGSTSLIKQKHPTKLACSPQAVANLLYALAKLQVRPRSHHLQRICLAVQPILPSLSGRDLSEMLWSFQRLHYIPDDDWMMDAQLALKSKLRQLDLPCSLMVLTALGGYSRISDKEARRGKLTQVDTSLADLVCTRVETLTTGHRLSQTSSITLLLAVAKLKSLISKDLHMRLLRHIGAYLNDIPPRELPLVCWAVCKLAARSGDMMHLRASSDLKILPRIAELTQCFLTSANSADLLQLVTGFSAVSFELSDSWLEHHEASAVRLARQGTLNRPQATRLFQVYRKMLYHPRSLALTFESLQAKQVAAMDRLRSHGNLEEDPVAMMPPIVLPEGQGLDHTLESFQDKDIVA